MLGAEDTRQPKKGKTIMSDNPYQAPQSDVATRDDTLYGDVKLLSLEGRLGRLRYIACYFALTMFIGVLMALAALLIDGDIQALERAGTVSYTLSIVFSIIFLMFAASLTVQRLHDVNAGGWWALLLLVPAANILLILAVLFIPGTAGSNRYGAQPPPNTTGVKVLAGLAIALAVLMVIGFVALFGFYYSASVR
jgi:uncharacterized membrane protein YhaH (DUF805 family)